MTIHSLKIRLLPSSSSTFSITVEVIAEIIVIMTLLAVILLLPELTSAAI